MIHCVCARWIALSRYLDRKRENDDEALFEKRIKEYDDNNPGVVALFKKAGSKVIQVD